MATAVGDLTVPLPWIRCAIGHLEDYDFICPDCERPICYDHGEEVKDDFREILIWVCVECVNEEPWYPLDGVSKIPEENLIVDSTTGDYVYLAAKDEEEIDRVRNSSYSTYDDIDRIQSYINIISQLFDLE